MVDAQTVQWILYPEQYKIVKLPANTEVAQPCIEMEQFVSIAYTADDVQVICPEQIEVVGSVPHSDGWMVLQMKGAYSVDNGKVVAEASRVLREVGIKLNVSAAFDTDYLLIGQEYADKAREAMTAAGYQVEDKQLLSTSA